MHKKPVLPVQNNECVSPDNCWNSAICKMLPWKEPSAQEFLAVDIVLGIVLSVQDLEVLVPFGESEFHGWSVQLFNLRHSKKAKETLLQSKCVIPEKEVFLQGDENAFFWTKMWEANPTLAERNQTDDAGKRSPFISDLPKKDKYKLKAGKTTLVLLAFLIF